MAVLLTISKTINGAGVADTLEGDPGNSGYDLGGVVDGEYCPITSKSANTGWAPVYISHDALIDPITEVKTFIAEFSQIYGGADPAGAAADLATLIAKGNASGNSANNSDLLSSGLRIEHGADLGGTLGASAFLGTRAQVKIYGDNNTDGIDLASAFTIHEDAMILASGPVVATTPVAGSIGKANDAVLGDRAFVKLRYYLEGGAPNGGIIQWDWVVAYSFTAALTFGFIRVFYKLLELNLVG